jgi:hypothetical protein
LLHEVAAGAGAKNDNGQEDALLLHDLEVVVVMIQNEVILLLLK